MSSGGSVKVLVTGSVGSQFTEYFDKITATNNKHGPFDIVLCVGNFFDKETSASDLDDLLAGKIAVPLTTYFMHGENVLPANIQQRVDNNEGEICENLYYLGKKGTMTTAQGLKIAFLSGVQQQNENTEEEKEQQSIYTRADIDTLKNTKFPLTAPPGVDILLTSEWPQGIHNGSSNTTVSPSQASSSISELALALKPRYHFADIENTFYEREPYTNVTGFGSDDRAATHVSRFIGLGKALNKNKQRWFYAYTVVPMAKASPDILNAMPPLTTDCPFWEHVGKSMASAGQKRGTTEDNSGFFWGGEDDRTAKKKRAVPDNYICKKCNVPGHYIKDCPEKKEYVCRICNEPGHHIRDCPKKESAPPRAPQADLSTCWFCLSNPKIEKHLITSIGTEIYATLAKGPLVSPTSSPIPGGGHILLIAITHYPTFGKVPNETRGDVISDLSKYKNALRDLYASYGQDMVLFEVSRESHQGLSHAHIQVVPVPKEKSPMLETVMREEAEQAGYELTDQIPPNGAYFDMELPDGKHVVHAIAPKERFNLQFGRKVIAKAMGQSEREDWKACSQSEAEERQASKDFKEAFKSFDPSV